MNSATSPAPQATRVPAWLPYAVGPTLIAILVTVLAGVAIWTEQLRYRERAAVATQNIARLLDAHLADRFDKIDATLRLAAHEYARDYASGRASPEHINQFLAAQQKAVPELLDLRIADAQGLVRPGKEPAGANPVSVARRAYFIRAQAGPASGLIIDAGLPPGAAGPMALVFARGLYSAEGRFLGVVCASLASDQFGPALSELDLGSRGTVALRRVDLALVQQFPPTAGAASSDPGAGIDAMDPLRVAVGQSPVAGYYLASSDGVERSNVYRRVRGYPFYLVVGLATDDYLEGWRANSFMFSALAGLTIALILIACVTLYRTATRQVESISSRYSAMMQNSPDAIIGASAIGLVTSWNRGATELFGYSAGEIIGQPLRTLVAPEREDEEAALVERLVRGESLVPFETLRLHKDGHAVAVSLTPSAVHDANGALRALSFIARDIRGYKAIEEGLVAPSLHDPLTRLPNRRLLADRLRRAQLRSRRQRSYFAVLFIEVDKFVQVNDRLGHGAADQLLVEVAKRLQLAVRQDDSVARLGGNEFVVLLEDLGNSEPHAVDHVNSVADKILNLLEQDYMLGDRRHQGSASIGIKLLLGGALNADRILKEASAAMYRVKQQRQSLLLGVFG